MQILTGTTKAGAILPRLYLWQPDGVISIERLLVWAVREQKALDRAARVGGLFEAEARAAGLPWQGASACGCAALAGGGGMPPCGHCEHHGIDIESCDRCGADTCGCTEERVELRQRARDYPWLVP